MQTEILERDVAKGTAKFKFTHQGITHTQSYDLVLVVPGTKSVLESLNQEFTSEMQDRVIEKVKEQVQREIEAGIIQNRI
jgi:hypothetical protein